jgi:Tfp pilus assembly protein PilV
MPAPTHPVSGRDRGFTLLEALVALGLVTMVVLSYLGIRTSALIDATEARNWRLARELAATKLSELEAGACEVPPKSGDGQAFEHYPGFRYQILIGEAAVNQAASDLASMQSSASNDQGAAADRTSWQVNRDMYRKASTSGMNSFEYQDKQRQDEEERLRQEKPASDTDLEEVAVFVYFPKVAAEHQGAEDAFVLKAKVSTLALSGLTPDQARSVAEAKGQTVPSANAPPGTGGSGSGSGSGSGGAPASTAGSSGAAASPPVKAPTSRSAPMSGVRGGK